MPPYQSRMTPVERRAAFSLATIFSLRMLGMFMILPVFSLYAETLGEVPPPILVGLAIGIYGLTQALLQIPFGMLSDRYGRKPIITVGLLLFAAGSVVAALSDTITGIIIGRALQGTGAIAAAVMALAADLTREEHRPKAMAVIGGAIGMAFFVALAAGPVLDRWIGVPGIFWLTAVLAVVGIGLLRYWVPRPAHCSVHRDAEAVPGDFSDVLKDSQLLRLDLGIFVLHLILTASFVALPHALRDHAGLDAHHHWYFYLPVLAGSVLVAAPFIFGAERYHARIKQLLTTAIALAAIAQAGLAFFSSKPAGIVVSLLLFFAAFNVLEAQLPALVARFAPADKKGTAMGVYSTAQFLGAFVGGVGGGAVYGHYGLHGVFGGCALAAASWWLWARTMRPPSSLTPYMIHVGSVDAEQAANLSRRLRELDGVAEASVVAQDGVAYLKIDRRRVDYQALHGYSAYSDGPSGGGHDIIGQAPDSAAQGSEGARAPCAGPRRGEVSVPKGAGGE